MNKITGFIIFLLLATADLAISANIDVESALDRNKAYMGDRIGYTLQIKADTTLRVDSVTLPEALGDFNVNAWQPRAERIEGGKRIIGYDGIIMAFKTGKLTIPGLPVIYHTTTGAADSVFTDSMNVYIMSLVLNDSTADIRPLKDALYLGRKSSWLYYAIPAILIMAAGFIWLRLRHKPAAVEAKRESLKSPWEEAHERLLRLRESRLPPKTYYIELSDAIREYLQRRYGFSAVEMTTSEIKIEVRGLDLAPELSERLVLLLEDSDLVKFAKFLPEREWIEADFQRAWNFVENTIPANMPSEVSA